MFSDLGIVIIAAFVFALFSTWANGLYSNTNIEGK